jgi:hypothetical protein
MGHMVSRITAVAELDDRPTAATATRERAAAGDGDNAWLLEEWDAGRLLLAEVVVSVAAADDDGHDVIVRRSIDGVWLELDEPPRVEEQIAGVAPTELAHLAVELRKAGVEVDETELQASYLHVELGDRLRAALAVI